MSVQNFDIFLIFAHNIDCGFTLEPPQRGGSNEYPQSMFSSKNKKNMYTRVNPTFFYIKVGCNGVFITRTCYPDVQIETKFCIHIIVDKFNIGIVNLCFWQICNRVTTLD